MRETEGDKALNLWVASTNKPYQTLAILWVVNGWLFIMIGIQFFFFFPILHLELLPLLFLAGFGVYFIIGAVFLFYDSQSIHHDPFPEDSSCKLHPDQPAYDWCAICGTLTCPQELVRIQQKFWGISPGMFGFDGVACLDCAQRRVKRSFMISAIIFDLAFLVLIFMGVSLILGGSVHLTGVLGFTLGICVFSGCLSIWFWRKIWQIVTTPLSEQPELMIPIKTRLVRRKNC